jgi:predicted metal-dependent RNase
MSKKKQNQIRISFVGTNSIDVTGSMILIEMNNYKILLECGWKMEVHIQF